MAEPYVYTGCPDGPGEGLVVARDGGTPFTDQFWYLWEQLHKLEPKSELGGIYAFKPGYHATRADNQANWPGNYSITGAEDKKGPSDMAAAIDWTFPSAQAGNYSTIMKYSKRLLASGRDPDDHRLDGWREFYGQCDTDSSVEGYDFRYNRTATSDPSHLWHIHLSCDRDKVASKANMDKLLSVLRGDDMPLTAADAQLVVDTWIRTRMSSPSLAIEDKTLGNWLKDGEFAQRAAEANSQAIADLTAKVDQILAAIAEGVVVPVEVSLTPESVAEVADATADEMHADPERDGV